MMFSAFDLSLALLASTSLSSLRSLRLPDALSQSHIRSMRRRSESKLYAYLFNRKSPSGIKAESSRFHPSDEAGVMLELVVKPVVFIFKADQDRRRPSVPRNNNLLASCKLNVTRQIILYF